ncbi:MAG: hypothetical protein K2Z81_04190 [Cyanobacteria bacterium]|nr:hypothetical protein [Cyanobacteriota bacterium]
MRRALWKLSLAGAVVALAIASTQVKPGHAFRISIGSQASDLLHGKIEVPTTAKSLGLATEPGVFLVAQAPPVSSQRTKLQVQNSSQPTVKVYLTVPSTSSLGGPTRISQVTVTGVNNIIIPVTSTSQQQGFFNLNTSVVATISASNPNNNINTFDNIMVSFNAPPQCPSSAFPNGVNSAEATLNPPQQSQQEIVDISCTTGANSAAEVDFRPGQGNNWNNGGGGSTDVEEIANSWVNVPGLRDNNCNLSGVFAFQLTRCTSGPAACAGGRGPFCTTSRTLCTIQRTRNATGFGGQVRVVYNGPIAPPS